ncbi:class I SAM-dependent methyltransferase [Palleronia sediminis]|uniref:Class I SAM-dependent methyltransferase n=1 Tax=Palleronia sediminis TaxID=2547833 RepID=A0A4R5ZYF1_9RHOB|nr:methyltransferase [Palleronia sediminis]TDL76241.1 class I SAM-dependent methyltransferase [Palleronia sediminis]
MPSPRLTLALDEGLIAAPVLLIGPPADLDLSDLPGPVAAWQDRQPDHDDLAARAVEMREGIDGPAATAVVFVPRERAAARDRIARAARACPDLLIDGQKTDGIDALLKECRGKGEVGAVISKAHGKIFAFRPDLALWPVTEPRPGPEGWLTAATSFSADGVDPASRLLADSLPPLAGRAVDLGAGWGYLARRVLEAGPDVTGCDLVEADRGSLDCARVNVTDPRAAFHWADATRWQPEGRIDHVVTNPPFHRGRQGDPGLGRAFIAAAGAMLAPRGTLWLVANRHLPYEQALGAAFAQVEERGDSPSFKLFRATRPRRAR